MDHFWETAVLSALQGITEFLPVSSSGHLALGKHLLGLETPGADLEVALHLGTLFSVLVYYRKIVAWLTCGLLRRDAEAWKYAAAICVSAIPAIAVYLIAGKRLESLFENSKAVGACLLFTGAVLFLTRFIKPGQKKISMPRALAMGCAQAVALLPGVSRSGATLTASRAMGMAADESARFSFLMCAPLIAGASAMKCVSWFKAAPEAGTLSGPALAAGMAIAAVVGYAALAFLLRVYKGSCFWMFGLYCAAAGTAAMLFL